MLYSHNTQDFCGFAADRGGFHSVVVEHDSGAISEAGRHPEALRGLTVFMSDAGGAL